MSGVLLFRAQCSFVRIGGIVTGELATRLRERISPERVVTSGPAWDACCAVWNGAVTRRPAVVLRCADVADAQAGVRAARELGVPLSVRGGGHGWTGSALTDGGLTIDLSAMRRVTVDAEAAVADVQGGATSGDLLRAAEAHGMVAVTGTVGAVGVAGLSLAGGYGPLTGRFGLAVDNVLAVDVVLADGSLVTADHEHEPELFWALRGGGANFGVVTGMRVRLHTAPAILAGRIMFPWPQSAAVLESLHDILRSGPDELTLHCGIVTGPGGQPVVFVAPTWCGDADQGERAIARITGLGDPLVAKIGPASLADMLAQADTMFPFGRHVEIRPRSVPGLTRAVADALVAGGNGLTSPFSAISVHSLHGAAARIPATDTAFAARTPHLVVENVAIWTAGDAEEARHRNWARDMSNRLADESLPGGYVNLLAPDESDQIANAYGPNRDRLLAAKYTYDPDEIFRATPMPGVAATN